MKDIHMNSGIDKAKRYENTQKYIGQRKNLYVLEYFGLSMCSIQMWKNADTQK